MKLLSHFFISFIIFFFLIIYQSGAQDIFGSFEKKFSKFKDEAGKERVLIITDRDVYEPGEMIWIDITTFDIFSPEVSEISSEATIYLVNQEDFKVLNKKVTLKEGSASSFIPIPSGTLDGMYFLKAETANSGSVGYYHKKLIIRDNVVPRYIIEASFPDKEFIPGDQFTMNLEFKDFYNEAKRNVDYQVDFFDGEKKVWETTGKTNKTGIASVNVKVPLKLRSGVFTYRVLAESKGGESSLWGKFPVLTDQLFIDFYPENGKIIDGMKTKINIHAYDLSGTPLTIEADLLEDENPVLTFTSDNDGLGSFLITPDIGKNYTVQMKRPLLLDKKYDLPPIEAKGIVLKLISKSQSQAKYQLVNGYQSVRLIYLVGVSEGEIFWSSEHELDREMEVDIDLSKASGRLVHLVVLNAAEHIEGESIMVIPANDNSSVEISLEGFSNSTREENQSQLKIDSNESGKVIFTAVNSPWMVPGLHNQSASSISLPSDIYRQTVFQQNGFSGSVLNAENVEKYMQYYVPFDFGIDRVVKQKGAYSYSNERINSDKLKFLNPLIGQYREEFSGGKVKQVNMLADDLFATSNPNYISGLYQNKKKKRAPYKDMLDKNMPVMEVLQVVKPYNLVGNNIVFMSSAVSISSQGGALIVIDGIASGTNPAVIRNLNPLTVESISASTKAIDIQRYTSLNTVGVIEITTKSGEQSETQATAVDEDAKFTSPDYSSKKGGPEDFRKTLYWDISPLQKEEGVKKITFYNSDLISKVNGRVYFIPLKGAPKQAVFEYELK